MTDHTVDTYGVTPERLAHIERATEIANAYAGAEGHPGGHRLFAVALSSLSNPRPTAQDRDCPEWPSFFPITDQTSDRDRELWEEAEANRVRWGEQRRELTVKNRKADADADAAQQAVAQAERDAKQGAELAAATEEIRRAYMQTPGGTEATLAAALPGLLEDRRRRMVNEQTTADDIALRAHREAFRI